MRVGTACFGLGSQSRRCESKRASDDGVVMFQRPRCFMVLDLGLNRDISKLHFSIHLVGSSNGIPGTLD